ncbi:vitamin D3 receptor B [Trichonephila clavipes]|nr:vitamin D3 receptor B [Trichonephila clavipes]
MSLPPNGSQQSPHHRMPPSDCPSASQHYSSPSRRQKVCGACGDRAKSYHFGGISCDSCKAFFRRSVQNEAYKNFHCPYEGKCEITITSRKCCQFCRFKKCLSIGTSQFYFHTIISLFGFRKKNRIATFSVQER